MSPEEVSQRSAKTKRTGPSGQGGGGSQTDSREEYGLGAVQAGEGKAEQHPTWGARLSLGMGVWVERQGHRGGTGSDSGQPEALNTGV